MVSDIQQQYFERVLMGWDKFRLSIRQVSSSDSSGSEDWTVGEMADTTMTTIEKIAHGFRGSSRI